MHDLINAISPDAPLAIVIIDGRGVIKEINHWMTRWTGLASADVKGKTFSYVFPEVDSQPWLNWALSAGACDPGSFAVSDTFRLQLACQEGVLEALLCLPAEMPDGTTDYALLFYSPRDSLACHQQFSQAIRHVQKIQLEHHTRLLEQLEHTRQQLMRNAKLAGIGELAAGVAHEINNPTGYVFSNLKTLEAYVHDMLRIIDAVEHVGSLDELRGLKRTLEYDYIRKDIEDLINESEEGVGRIRTIVGALKYFAHEDDTGMREADLNQGIDSTVLVAHNEIKYKAKVAINFADLPKVVCNISQINQVVMNLLINAAHAIEDSGTITIRTGVDGHWVWFEISDDGCGMAPEVVERLFDPFFTTKPAGKGTGLGLPLSYNIIKKHNGRIQVQTEPGNGTAFTVWLPVRPDLVSVPAQ